MIRYCVECGEILTGKSKMYCSRKCQMKNYYKQNKERIDASRKEWYRAHRVLKPKPPKKSRDAWRAYQKRRYWELKSTPEGHEKLKESARKSSKTYYEKHKNEEHFREVHRQNMRKYIAKRQQIINQ